MDQGPSPPARGGPGAVPVARTRPDRRPPSRRRRQPARGGTSRPQVPCPTAGSATPRSWDATSPAWWSTSVAPSPGAESATRSWPTQSAPTRTQQRGRRRLPAVHGRARAHGVVPPDFMPFEHAAVLPLAVSTAVCALFQTDQLVLGMPPRSRPGSASCASTRPARSSAARPTTRSSSRRRVGCWWRRPG